MAQSRKLITRLGLAGILVALVFLAHHVYQALGPTRSYWPYFTAAYLILVGFVAYQVLRAAAVVAVSWGTSSTFFQALHMRGVRGTMWEIYRRRLTPGLRLPLILGTWLLAIFTVVWILWRTHFLEDAQARLMSSFVAGRNGTADAISKVVQLRTRDNNTGRYYRAILNLARDLNHAGAKLVMAEQSRFEGPHSPWISVLDSLARLGVLLYESGEGTPQSLPLPNPAPGDWRYAHLLDQARLLPEEHPAMIAFRPVPSWYSQQLHCALHAVALLRGDRTIQQPLYLDGAIRYADLRIPVTREGESFVPLDATLKRTVAALVLLKEEGDTLLYVDDSHPEAAPTISPSLASLVRGQIVLAWSGLERNSINRFAGNH
jgi:hypothetical protein